MGFRVVLNLIRLIESESETKSLRIAGNTAGGLVFSRHCLVNGEIDLSVMPL